MELQEAMEIAMKIHERGVDPVIWSNPSKAADHLVKLAAAVVKLGGNTIRPRTATARGITPPKV